MGVIAGGFFPLNNTVTVYFSDSGSDAWGIPVNSGHVATYKVRLEFNGAAKLIQVEGEGAGNGKEIVFKATIYFKGSVPITYQDFLEYDSGVTGLVKAQPKNIMAMPDLSGKVVYTKVII
jgi:hypothetical protein